MSEPEAPPERARVRWWHRDHPTFLALSGFFAGLVYIIVVPSVVAGLVSLAVSSASLVGLLPWLGLALLVPVVLAAVPRTRRFGLYMLLGVAVTLVTVGVVAAATLAVLGAVDA